MILVRAFGFLLLVPAILLGGVGGVLLPFALLGSLLGSVPWSATIMLFIASIVGGILGSLGMWMSGLMKDEKPEKDEVDEFQEAIARQQARMDAMWRRSE